MAVYVSLTIGYLEELSNLLLTLNKLFYLSRTLSQSPPPHYWLASKRTYLDLFYIYTCVDIYSTLGLPFM